MRKRTSWPKKERCEKALQKNYMKVVVKKLSRAGMVPARTWGVHAARMSPTERLKLRRQMAATAGKKNTTSLSLFMEVYCLELGGGTLHLGHAVLGRRSLGLEPGERTCRCGDV